MKTDIRGLLLGLAGAIAGGILGYFAFLWIARHGYYALMLPGAGVGIGGGSFVKTRSVPRGIICGVFALLLGIFSEWSFAPFIKDASLGYFLGHLQDLSAITLLMIAAGACFGFWFSAGRENPTAPRSEIPPV